MKIYHSVIDGLFEQGYKKKSENQHYIVLESLAERKRLKISLSTGAIVSTEEIPVPLEK